MSLRAVMMKRWLLNQCSTTQATHNELVKCNSQQMYPFYQALPPQSILRKKVNEMEFSSVPYLVVCASEYILCVCTLYLMYLKLACNNVLFGIGHLTMYHLCGDNLDKGIKQRYMRIDNEKPASIHYFHSFAVADRIDFSNLSDQLILTEQRDAELVAKSLLPIPEDNMAFRTNICILMSRILYQNMEYFKHSFDPVIDWHIKHEFYDEMSTKSTVLSSHSIRGGAAFVRIVRQ